jgi:broad specificity phosphatase PhoE
MKSADAHLICMRHAQSVNVSAHQAGALSEVPLTDLGRHQAEVAARSVAGAGITAIYASTAVRAEQTARVIGSHLGLPVVLAADLTEVWLGVREGAIDEATHQMTAEVLRAWIVDGNLAARVADGETGYQVQGRVSSTLKRIGLDHGNQPVLIIGHVASLTTGINALCGNGPDVWGSPLPHAVAFTMTRHEQTWHCTWPVAHTSP